LTKEAVVSDESEKTKGTSENEQKNGDFYPAYNQGYNLAQQQQMP
jgi:hypothetical protein